MKVILLILIAFSIVNADLSRSGNSVSDSETNLQWQDDAVVADKDKKKSWTDAINYCENLTLDDKSDWRLPNKTELLSIVDYSVYAPAMSPVFQHITSYGYRSSTAYAGTTSRAWDVSFYGGHMSSYYKTDNGYVRCVRGGQFDNLEMPINAPTIEESGNPDAVYRFSVDLNASLANGEYVAINFDNLQGDWFTQADAGGHIPLTSANGVAWGLDTNLNKPGLRSFRAGVFDANGIQLSEYSDYTTCTLDRCLAEATQPTNYGNPALSGSGSQLFGGVDVANGNLHYSATDMSVAGKGPNFTLMRSYNSNADAWSFNLDMAISFVADTFSRQVVISSKEDGREQAFYKDMDKLWYALSAGNFDKLIEESDGSFTLYTQGNLYYRFAQPTSTEEGRLLSINDRDSNSLSFSHTSNLITGATDASGRTYTITRASSGEITKVADFTGREVSYVYDSNKMITEYKNPRGLSTKYTFNGTKLSTIKDPKNNTLLSVSYNTSGDYVNYTEFMTFADGNRWEYLYTDSSVSGTIIRRPQTNSKDNTVAFIVDNDRTKVIQRIDAQSAGAYTTSTQFKKATNRKRIAEFGLVEKITQANSAEIDTTYYDDGRGNPATITGELNKLTGLNWADEVSGQTNLTPLTSIYKQDITAPMTYMNFTKSGKPTKIINQLGSFTEQTYSSAGQLTQMKDARANSTAIGYDGQGRANIITDALGNSTRTSYDSLGNVSNTTDARGMITSYTYDANGNMLTMTDAIGGVITYTYDNSDNLSSVKDARDTVIAYTYDSSNRKISQSYSIAGVSHTRSYEYDALGRVHKVTNESANVSESVFDERGQVISSINPLSQSTSYTYDASSNVLTITDAEGRTLRNEYDMLNRKTKVTDSLGLYEAYTYTSQDLLETKRDKKGLITSYEYDYLGQMLSVTKPNGSVTRATYDANGNLASTTDPKGNTVTYSYNAVNRMMQQTDAVGRSWSFTYDAIGNMRSKKTPDNKTTTYSYDSLNRVVQVSYADGQTVSYTYDANGNRLSMVDAQGTSNYTNDELNRLTSVSNSFGVSVSYAFHPTGTLKTLTYPNDKNVTYSYDDASRLSSFTDWLGDTTSYERDDTGYTTQVNYANATTVQKVYDNAGRLTSLSNTKGSSIISSHILTLDAVGSPTTVVADIPLLPTNLGRASDMLYDSSNRVTKINDLSITHDVDGRVTADVTHADPIAYAYNAQDLITTIHVDGTLSDEFTYDGDGHRTSKTVGSDTTRYLHDITGGDVYALLAETDSSNAVEHYYIYAEGLVAQVSGTTHKYYHYDQNGNTLALSDDSGVVTDKYAYEPFGATTVEGSSHNPFRFVGQYGVMDDGNGLHYMRARYYRSDMKRFLSKDALSGQVTDPMTLNRYQYVSGNPMVGVDPSGYKSMWSMFKEGFMDGYIGMVWNPKSEDSVFATAKDIPSMYTEAGNILIEEIPKLSPAMDKVLDEVLKNSDSSFEKGFIYYIKGVKHVTNNYTIDRYTAIIEKCIKPYNQNPNSINIGAVKSCISNVKDLASPSLKIGTKKANIDLDIGNIKNSRLNSENISSGNQGIKVQTENTWKDFEVKPVIIR